MSQEPSGSDGPGVPTDDVDGRMDDGGETSDVTDVTEAAGATTGEDEGEGQPAIESADRETLRERIEALEAENDRLRAVARAAQRRRYRRTALGLGMIGVVALGGALAIPELREVLVALGATGVFGAILTYFLTPERFVAASVGERIYGTLADNERAIADDLDLRGRPVVVPATGSAAPARLFVPMIRENPDDRASIGAVPDAKALASPFVVDEPHGLSIEPTGAPLYDALTDAAGELPSAPADVASVAGDALVEQFELVDAVEVDAEPGRVTVAVDGSAYGPLDRFDHPVASLLATALAVELEAPVAVSVDEGGDRGEWLITCRWEA